MKLDDGETDQDDDSEMSSDSHGEVAAMKTRRHHPNKRDQKRAGTEKKGIKKPVRRLILPVLWSIFMMGDSLTKCVGLEGAIARMWPFHSSLTLRDNVLRTTL